MNCTKLNKIKSDVQHLWHIRNACTPLPIISVIYMNKSIKIHEFILCEYFNTYEILKKDLTEHENIKELVLSSSIIFDNYHLEYKYFELIIKYLYGLECDLEGILLNDLYKIHAFMKKHCMDDSKLMSAIENKIHHTIYYLPDIDICGGLNKYDDYIIKHKGGYLDTCGLMKKANQKYKHYYSQNSADNFFKMPYITINNLDELFDKFNKYLLDQEIYDYALPLIFEKYSLNNNEYTFKSKNMPVKKTDNETQIMDKLGYYVLMRHKYYTLSFLNKNFKKIKMDDLFNGQCNKYIHIKHLYTKHAIMRCAELEQNNKPKIEPGDATKNNDDVMDDENESENTIDVNIQ